MIRLKETDLLQCCHSAAWAHQMAAHSFPNVKEVFATGDSIWWSLSADDWKEAFAFPPKIGDHIPETSKHQMSTLQRAYLERFQFPFVLCAAGKTAHFILVSLRERSTNDPESELKIAAEQQRQVTHLRLKRLLAPFK